MKVLHILLDLVIRINRLGKYVHKIFKYEEKVKYLCIYVTVVTCEIGGTVDPSRRNCRKRIPNHEKLPPKTTIYIYNIYLLAKRVALLA